MCINAPGPVGPTGAPGIAGCSCKECIERLGPPTLTILLREWIAEDPVLSKHFYINSSFMEGGYIEVNCSHKGKLEGWSFARIPNEGDPDSRVMMFHHGTRLPYANKPTARLEHDVARVKGYLRREDPQFIEKLRALMIKGHDMISDRINCKIKWEFGDLLPDYELYYRQMWWEDGNDL